jgi:site-specific DNA recombinase
VCAARQVGLEEIDEPVWAQILPLLENPLLIKAEIERRLSTLRAEHPASHRRNGPQRELTRAQNTLRRLIDGYQEQLITLEELRARMPELGRREATLRAELHALDAELHDAETYLSSDAPGSSSQSPSSEQLGSQRGRARRSLLRSDPRGPQSHRG